MTERVKSAEIQMMPPELENWPLIAYEVHLKERVKSAEIQMLSKDDTEIKLKVLAPTSGSYQIIGNLLINRPKDVLVGTRKLVTRYSSNLQNKSLKSSKLE